MYPRRELTELACAKSLLRRRIAAHRAQCVESVAVVTAPLVVIDSAMALWRKLSPWIKIAAVPLALLLKRSVAPRAGIVSSVLRWAPALLSAVRSFQRTRA